MHTALWKLFGLRMRGSARAIFSRLKTPRGAALGVFTLLVIGMMLGPNLIMVLVLGHAGAPIRADWLRDAVPPGMLLFVVLNIVSSIGERALYFTPSEVDFLFPGPFSRRELLLYKILGSVTAAIYFGLFFPVMVLRNIHSWPAASAGFFLASLMISSLTLCAQLVGQTITEHAFTRARRLLFWGVFAAAAAVLGQAAAGGIDETTLLRARHSPAAEIILAPFAVFAKVITAERLFSDALGWAALAAAMVIGVFALTVRLDANYLETAARVSQQLQERRRRMTSEGIFASRLGEVRHSRLPRPRWWGGAGPLVWRQVIQALRGSRGAMIAVAIMVVALGTPLFFATRASHETAKILPHMIIGLAAYVTFFFSAQAPLGFRTDYERMDLLKMLPIRPLAMAFGQTLVVATVLTLLQWLVFAATALAVPGAAGEMLAAGLFAAPYNWIICGTENLLFLFYPSPMVPTGSEGFLKMGRVMLFMLAKFLALGACTAATAIPTAIVFLMTQSVPAACVVAWIFMACFAVGVLLLIAWAFPRCEVNVVVTD
jgi:hypothetical protein